MMKELTQEIIEGCERDPIDTNWTVLCLYYNLPESFIRKYANKMSWVTVCSKQTLSEEFIEEMNLIHFSGIPQFQNISEEFILKHIDTINIVSVFDSAHRFSEELLAEIILRGKKPMRIDIWGGISYV